MLDTPKKVELTRLGKQVIPVELAGRNARYVSLKNPKYLTYPNGNEFSWCDDYICELYPNYDLVDTLGANIEQLAKARGVERFVMGSPLRNKEGETILGYMLVNSAQRGMWQPFVIDVPKLTDTHIKTAKEYLEEVDKISPTYDKGMVDGGILFGLAIAKRGGFALTVEHDNKVIAIPSQELVEYFAQKK